MVLRQDLCAALPYYGSMAEDYAEPSFRMSPELNRRLRIAAAKEDMSRAELVRRVLNGVIDDLEADGLDSVEKDGGEAIEAD